MKVAGLFSGVGGLELAAHRAGFDTKFLCELDPVARVVLEEHFSPRSLERDVTRVRRLPKDVDLVAAGFPCQNLSPAGNKVGIVGSKSSLVAHLFRLLRNRRVPWVVVENVYFMLHAAGGSAMTFVTDSLEELGYTWAYRVVDSVHFGVPQRRRRLYLVATLDGDPREVVFADNHVVKQRPSLRLPMGFYWTEGLGGVGFAPHAVPPLKAGSTIGIPSPPAILFPDHRLGTPDIRDAERLQGFPVNWTACASRSARKSARWRLVGNAVTVPVARWIFSRIRRPGALARSYLEAPLATGIKWPTSAWGSKKHGRHSVHGLSEGPIEKVTPSIESFLRFPLRPLSERATAGFLERAGRSALKYPKGFLESIQVYRNRLQA